MKIQRLNVKLQFNTIYNYKQRKTKCLTFQTKILILLKNQQMK